MLTELEMQKRTSARNAFLVAVWQGEEPARLLPLANEAGWTSQEADRLVQRVRQAKEDIVHTNRLPALRKDAAGKLARFEKVQSRAAAEIERLEDEVETAAAEAGASQKAVYAAEASARQLLILHDEGLLPEDQTPNEVRRLIERRAAEERSREADRARMAAREERNRYRQEVQTLERRLTDEPLAVMGSQSERALKARLKDAKHELDEAEERLAQAETSAETARNAIP